MPSLPEAVESKYGKPLFDLQIIEVAACVSLSLRGCGIFRPPSVLILADCDIEEAGDENELRKQCDGVTELDLSRNRFKTWKEIFKILQFVPSLTFLNLSYNTFDNNCSNFSCCRFNKLGKLILNGTGLAWKDVYSLLALTPGLEELHLCLNGYERVDKSSSSYRTIKRLHFNCNPVHQWEQIEMLGCNFPSLEILILADCPIGSLNADCPYDKIFPRLKYLSLNNSKIDSWESIDLINKFPLLLELRLQQCPLFEHYKDDERRNLIIARLEFVQRLNGGSNFTLEEKENAERCFIRHYINFNSEKLPKRYFDLVDRHGYLDPLVNVSLRPTKSVHVTIRHEETVLEKTISVYMKVLDLKRMIAPELGVVCSHIRVFYVDKANGEAYAPEELKINNKQLYTLNVNSGDEFIIDYKRNLKEDSHPTDTNFIVTCKQTNYTDIEVKKRAESASVQGSQKRNPKEPLSPKTSKTRSILCPNSPIKCFGQSMSSKFIRKTPIKATSRVISKIPKAPKDSSAEELLDSKSKELSDSESKELSDSESKELSDPESKELSDSESKELSDSESKELSDSKSKELSDFESKES